MTPLPTAAAPYAAEELDVLRLLESLRGQAIPASAVRRFVAAFPDKEASAGQRARWLATVDALLARVRSAEAVLRSAGLFVSHGYVNDGTPGGRPTKVREIAGASYLKEKIEAHFTAHPEPTT